MGLCRVLQLIAHELETLMLHLLVTNITIRCKILNNPTLVVCYSCVSKCTIEKEIEENKQNITQN